MSGACAALFISHGAPTLAVDDTPAHRFLLDLGQRLEPPRAILCISAHWETVEPTLGGAVRPETIHDFRGFPAALYRLRYPAPGDPALAREIAELLSGQGFEARIDDSRGLDHGVWVPLSLLFPEARIPVVPLSVQPARGPAHHLALGRALRPLAQRGVLIVASGALTHNLAEVLPRIGAGPAARFAPPAAWAQRFCAWVEEVLGRGDLEALAGYRARAPHAARAHPTEEHLLPLMVAAAAGGGYGRKLHESYEYGSLAMSIYAFAAAGQEAGS